MTTSSEPCPKTNLELLIVNLEERIRAVNITHYDLTVNNKFPPILSDYTVNQIVDLLEMARPRYERDLWNYQHNRLTGD